MENWIIVLSGLAAPDQLWASRNLGRRLIKLYRYIKWGKHTYTITPSSYTHPDIQTQYDRLSAVTLHNIESELD